MDRQDYEREDKGIRKWWTTQRVILTVIGLVLILVVIGAVVTVIVLLLTQGKETGKNEIFPNQELYHVAVLS